MSVERCPICGNKTERKIRDLTHVYCGVPINLSDIPHSVCEECGEEFINSRYGRICEESINQYRKSKKYEYNDLLTCEEVAGLLAVSYQVVLSMLSDGKLPGTKIGREWRIPYGILMEYIQSMSANNLSKAEKEIYQIFKEESK